MGRIINETDSSTIADADYLLKDNASSGTTKMSGANLKTQFEIVARKGQASGYAELDSTGKVPAAQLRSAFTIEEVANAAARNALTVISAEVGVRQVRLADTGVIYVPNAAGTGSGIWVVYNSQGYASTSAQGNVELATATEGATGESALLVPAVDVTRAMIAQQRTALAPMQGWMFNKTAGATIAVVTPGARNFSVAAWFSATSLAANNVIVDGPFALYVATDGSIRVLDRDGAAGTIFTSDAGLVVVNRRYLIVYTRGKVFLNGKQIGSTFTNTATYTTALTYLGYATSNDSYCSGFLRPLFYNCALSATEVLALYESGAPEPGHFGIPGTPASETSIVTGDNSSFASDTGYWGATGSAAIAAGVLSCPSSADYISRTSFFTSGKKYRITAGTITGQMQVSDGVTATPLVSGGSVEITAGGTTIALGTASTGTLDSVSVYPIGVICAPGADAPGNGYQWHDTSGNKLDLTRPTAGVEWAVPNERPNFVRGTLTWAGTHEAKSLLSQRALPTGAVVTLITRDATAASSGSGCTIGTTGTAAKWQAADTFTTAKEVATLAAQIPTDDTASQNDIVVDPDTANFTGSISVDVHFALTQGT